VAMAVVGLAGAVAIGIVGAVTVSWDWRRSYSPAC
jgi:hypothetical protein